MRSHDDTYYNIKLLHVVFALSSALLVAVTVWMFAADHQREWKQYQRTYRDRIEPWLAESQLARQKTAAFVEKEAELQAALEAAAAAIPADDQVEDFVSAAQAAGETDAAADIETAYEALLAAPSEARRETLMDKLETLVDTFQFRYDELDRQRRAKRARFDKARSEYEIAAGGGAGEKLLSDLRSASAELQQAIDQLSRDIEMAESEHRTFVQLLAAVTAEEDEARSALDAHRAEVEQYQRALAAQPDDSAEELARLPFVDAFGRSEAVEQIWLPDLTIDYNFRQVARFDRCTTCHLGIDKIEPGTSDEPAIAPPGQLALELATPDEPPEDPATVESLYGLTLAPRGILSDSQPTISLVRPASAAAWAGLQSGDVIRSIDGTAVSSSDEAHDLLREPDEWGTPLALEIERGLPQPYCGHPRLDLYVASSSPHSAAEYGCTICHDGQGSATEFKFASHTPDTTEDRRRWRERYGWFRNEHWEYPMRATRFIESSCLQCHHEVTDLEPTDRFPEPPAPKLLAGYHLVRQNGCFGCHEIRGFDASGSPIGPDLRLEPLWTEAAQELAASPSATEEERQRAEKLVARPHEHAARENLIDATQSRLAEDDLSPDAANKTQRLLDVLRSDGLHPGTMRKVGPSLRDVAARFEADTIERWIADPAGVRPTTRMPQFFGLHEHLEGEELEQAQRFEAVEIGAIRCYLLGASQESDLLPAPAEVTEEPSPDRGETLFVERGCAACHRHEDVPDAQSTVGPDLTGLGSMIATQSGRAWLVSWLRNPQHLSPRTPMPNPLLEPEPTGGDTETGRPRMSDPAADLAAYLLESQDERLEAFPPVNRSDLDELARLHLSRQFSSAQAEKFLAAGIPAEMAAGDLGDAVELIAPISREKKLRYVGRRTIRKRGCYGCHDIPGFEGAQLIGPALTDWGGKQESLLAFEQVHRFLEEHPPGESAGSEEDRRYFLDAIAAGRREGFLWQKLRQPRSFDFRKTEHKGFNEQLTMGRFSLTASEREQIMTFVLGLVADPPNPPYVHSPDRRTQAIAAGRKVLDRYGCAECHTMKMERWRFRYDPEWWESPYTDETFEFVRPEFSAEDVAQSLVRDRTGWGTAEVVGRPLIDPSGEVVLDEDDDGNPLYVFSLWEPALINGEVWRVGGAQVPIAEPHILTRHPPWGGAFARLLYPYAAEEAGASWLEAWGQVPPALVGEGALVQPDWLYDYMLDPAPIRPSSLLRMPKFNLSPEEAATLVDYFAAVSDVAFPYTAGPSNGETASDGHDRSALMDQAMRLVTDRTTYCAKCHLIGDYNPGGETQTILAPNLAEVGRRIRPEYLRRWLADPKSILPYTGMPVNFPPEGPPMGQDLLPGSSREQLDAVANLLLHYDAYLQKRTSIRTMIDKAAGEAENQTDD